MPDSVGFLARQHLRKELSERSIESFSAGGKVDFRVRLKGDESPPKLSIRVYAGSGEHFTLRKSDLALRNCILAYVWDADLTLQ